MTTTELLTEWMTNEQQERIKAQTYARYKGLIDLHIVPALGEQDISILTRRQISDFLTEKRHSGNRRYDGGLSPISINLMLSILNMAFDYAYDREYVENNPCDRVKRVPAIDRKHADAFTKEEQRKLEQTIEAEDDDRLFGIILCFYTGLRIGELLGLEWCDISEDCRILTISKTVYRGKDKNGEWQLCIDDPKTASSYRLIPLPQHISDHLCSLREKSNSRYVVQNKKGERMSIRSYQYIFERLTEKAGVRKLNFHAIRHTFATRALENGVDIKTLSDIMGHKDASITLNRYAHSMMDTKIEMMKRMTKIF